MDHHPPATLSTELLDAYRRADYRVATPDGTIRLAIGQPCPRLDRVLQQHGTGSAALVTACNPFSRPLPDVANRRRMARLLAAATGLRLAWLEGSNRDPGQHWPDEPSLLLLGLRATTADALATHFGQWGYLWAAVGAPVTLRVRHTPASEFAAA